MITAIPKNDWIGKESEWAAATANMNFIPVFCDNFATNGTEVILEDGTIIELPDSIKKVLSSQNIEIQKNATLDANLDRLCDVALKNANPLKPLLAFLIMPFLLLFLSRSEAFQSSRPLPMLREL